MVKITEAPRSLSTYEALKEAEKTPIFKDLLSCGIIPINFLDYKVIFEFYLHQEKLCKYKGQAVTNTAEEFGQSERSIRWIIKKMRD